jgi:hypothetical protein
MCRGLAEVGIMLVGVSLSSGRRNSMWEGWVLEAKHWF